MHNIPETPTMSYTQTHTHTLTHTHKMSSIRLVSVKVIYKYFFFLTSSLEYNCFTKVC